MSPFFGSIVEPISTSLVSFFRIEVVSFGTMELATGAETTPDGTVAFPPHAEVARSAPAVSISTRLLKVGILNLAPNAVVTKRASKCIFHRLQERATPVHFSKRSGAEKTTKVIIVPRDR
jgi:hypothetical protein